jgi:hypothetical protein
MEGAQIPSNQARKADYQLGKIAQPGGGPPDLPPMLISPLDFGRRLFVFPVPAVRHQRANSLACQAGPQFVQIPSLIADGALGHHQFLGFVRAPEGNGCAERFARILKEKRQWMRTFRTVEELRQALLEIQSTYNENWLIQRRGHETPAGERR